MKTIGILGGMSPESTIHYYEQIIHGYLSRFGTHQYPEIVIYSVTFEPYIQWQEAGEWDQMAKDMIKASRRLEAAGANFIVIATNTMHKVVDEVQAAVQIPILSMLDVVAQTILDQGLTTVGLLGTMYTMTDGFYVDGLEKFGLSVIVPDDLDRHLVHDVIFSELIKGEILPESRQKFIEIIRKLETAGAEGIVLGCTEIPMLISAGDVNLPIFDTTHIHAEAALVEALRE
jgi:aspartate racemase